MSLHDEITGERLKPFCSPLRHALDSLNDYGSDWAPYIKMCIRKGYDIHHDLLSGTLFDCIWSQWQMDYYFNTAKEWLSILEDEGIDINAYLKKEIEIQSKEQARHEPEKEDQVHGNGIRWQLFFRRGNDPNAWFDWYNPPDSPASFVRQEHRAIIMPAQANLACPPQWEHTWPFVFPWAYPRSESLALDRIIDRATKVRLAYRRLDRKAKKKHSIRNHMPGTWIELPSTEPEVRSELDDCYRIVLPKYQFATPDTLDISSILPFLLIRGFVEIRQNKQLIRCSRMHIRLSYGRLRA